MSFGLVLLPDPIGPSSLEASGGERENTGEPSDPQAWDAIVAGVRDILGEVVLGQDGPTRTLIHQPSGIIVRHRSGEAAVDLPCWPDHETDATWLVEAVYRIGHVVEDATGLVAYAPQLGVPLTEAESRVDDALDALTESDLTCVWPRDGFAVYFTGTATLADAAQCLKRMVVAEESDRLTVQGPESPPMEVTFAAGPGISHEAAFFAKKSGTPEMATHGRRFLVTFDDFEEVIDEMNTLIDVSLHLQDITRGYVVRSWNREVSPPFDEDPTDGS
ncbi:hypothetical protein F4558_003675 [Micromonospora profundi]|uniref:hypothetical protein n=1 Tax=Micromonospora profundi TaxID=1420889 RepID=UPI00143B78D7|nr:hypothetical protein [Micromonospora profundi]NJC13849.1 hypothetical protein [Micromonospora profundi]